MFLNKSKNQTIPKTQEEITTEQLFHFLELKQYTLPSYQETIETIIKEFTEEQLQQLAIWQAGIKISFQKLLLFKYKNHSSVYAVEETKRLIRHEIDKHLEIFKLGDRKISHIFFDYVCESFFTRFINK